MRWAESAQCSRRAGWPSWCATSACAQGQARVPGLGWGTGVSATAYPLPGWYGVIERTCPAAAGLPAGQAGGLAAGPARLGAAGAVRRRGGQPAHLVGRRSEPDPHHHRHHPQRAGRTRRQLRRPGDAAVRPGCRVHPAAAGVLGAAADHPAATGGWPPAADAGAAGRAPAGLRRGRLAGRWAPGRCPMASAASWATRPCGS